MGNPKEQRKIKRLFRGVLTKNNKIGRYNHGYRNSKEMNNKKFGIAIAPASVKKFKKKQQRSTD